MNDTQAKNGASPTPARNSTAASPNSRAEWTPGATAVAVISPPSTPAGNDATGTFHWSVIPPKPEAAADAVVVAKKPLEPGNVERGGKVYGTYCVGCHAVDGKANGGTTGANFVDDTTRLAKTDAELLTSIAEGKTGTIGTMPPWKGALTEQQRVDALAYVRATFGAK